MDGRVGLLLDVAVGRFGSVVLYQLRKLLVHELHLVCLPRFHVLGLLLQQLVFVSI